MSCCSVPAIKPGLLVLLFTALSAPSAWAASGSCAGLAAMPAAMEIDQGIQQNVRSSVAITRIAVGDPKIADVHVNGIDGFLLTGVAQGTTSLMVWTTCASAPRQSMVFVRGRATASMVERADAPSAEAQLPSQVQTTSASSKSAAPDSRKPASRSLAKARTTFCLARLARAGAPSRRAP